MDRSQRAGTALGGGKLGRRRLAPQADSAAVAGKAVEQAALDAA